MFTSKIELNKVPFDDNSASVRNTTGMPAALQLVVFEDAKKACIWPLSTETGDMVGVVDFEAVIGEQLPFPYGMLLDVVSDRGFLSVIRMDQSRKSRHEFDLRMERLRFDSRARKWITEPVTQSIPPVSSSWRSELSKVVASLQSQKAYEATGLNPFDVSMFSPWGTCLLTVDGKKALVQYRGDNGAVLPQVGLLLESKSWRLQNLGMWRRIDQFQSVDDLVFVLGLRSGGSEPTLSVFRESTGRLIWEKAALAFGVSGKTPYSEYLKACSDWYGIGK